VVAWEPSITLEHTLHIPLTDMSLKSLFLLLRPDHDIKPGVLLFIILTMEIHS
jgi:hypothetical protein